MPQIRVLQAVAGLEFSWSPGQEVEVSDEQATVWADGYRAELGLSVFTEPALARRAPEASRPVALNHPHCATFCVLGGAACSR